MNDKELIESLRNRYVSLSHAMQTGVSYHQSFSPDNGSPKHLRVGVNSALRDLASVVKLLIDKGFITELEYWTAMVAGMEEEVEFYQDMLQQHYGPNTKIKLM